MILEERFKNIIFKDDLIAQIYNFNISGNLIFPTPESKEMQCGFGDVIQEKEIKPHIHKKVLRNIKNTSEFIYIIEGEMDVYFLDSNGVNIANEKIVSGQAFLQFYGGHKIIIKSNTRYFELKQGPYLGKELDKNLIK
tara:strand:- start:644 stop:1057 length:414 start_codon:yes stop_codon:yes gene_type:complete